MSYEHILVSREGGVTTITFNRPDRLNACPPAMALEIRDVLTSDREARCFVLTGEGRAFCSGADLAGGGDDATLKGGRGSYDALSTGYNPLMMAMAQCHSPIISAVNGPAAGIGCSIALAADFTIAGSSAYFLQAFVNIGLVPDGGASWMLPRMVGKARATEMMLLGEKIPAEKAADWGLIYKAVADDALAQAACDGVGQGRLDDGLGHHGRRVDFADAGDAGIGVHLDDEGVLGAVAAFVDNRQLQPDGFDVSNFHSSPWVWPRMRERRPAPCSTSLRSAL